MLLKEIKEDLNMYLDVFRFMYEDTHNAHDLESSCYKDVNIPNQPIVSIQNPNRFCECRTS